MTIEIEPIGSGEETTGGIGPTVVIVASFSQSKIIYNPSEVVVPSLGPSEELPPFDAAGMNAVGMALNLQPPTVFSTPVKVFIPCPGVADVSSLSVYWYNGKEWLLACGPDGIVASTAEGFMVPGSRVNYPSVIEIKIYHFTGLVAVEMLELGGDLDHDGDVDGSDLAVLIGDPGMMPVAAFALDFGKTGGP